MLVVMLRSVVVFALLGRPDLPIRLASRIVLVPLIAGVAYEILKFGGRNADRWLTRLLLLPGMRLQRATTRQPDDAILEVAIAALLRVLVADGHVAHDDARLERARQVDGAGKPLPRFGGASEPVAMAAD
jgi:uncharacterized protein YqhQ